MGKPQFAHAVVQVSHLLFLTGLDFPVKDVRNEPDPGVANTTAAEALRCAGPDHTRADFIRSLESLGSETRAWG